MEMEVVRRQLEEKGFEFCHLTCPFTSFRCKADSGRKSMKEVGMNVTDVRLTEVAINEIR